MFLSNFIKKDSFPSSATRGLLAGFIGGFVGSAVKSTVENFLEVREIDEKTAQVKVLNKFSKKLMGTSIGTENEGVAKHLVNVPLGGTVGAIYGYGKRDKDSVSLLDGAILGGTTWFSTHETTLPFAGVEKSPEKVPTRIQAQELLAHVVFGVTTEIVRGYVNKKLQRREKY